MVAMRALNDQFLNDLDTGLLSKVAKTVQLDSTLCLELRGEAINVYYRGGNLMKIEQTTTGYRATFDKNYFNEDMAIATLEESLTCHEDINEWLREWPNLKRAMDMYISQKVRKDEREAQQLFVRTNNGAGHGSGMARSTDFYICDVEYTHGKCRFDMIAVHWPSKGHLRRKPCTGRLVIVEVKHGDKALKGSAGLIQHVRDVDSFLENTGRVDDLKNDMVRVFRQKRILGLMDCKMDLKGFSHERPILLLALVNHDPGSRRLHECVEELREKETPHTELRIGTASFFGYGLYDQGIHTVEEALRRFGNYVYKDSRALENPLENL